jgi:hypothetical protein
VLDSSTLATLGFLPLIARGPFPTCFRCACAASFIAYGAFEVTYLFPGTKVPRLLALCLSLLGARCRSPRRARPAGRHLTFARPWHSQSYESSCSRLALFSFPAFSCSVLLGFGFSWPSRSVYHRLRFSPHSFAVCTWGTVALGLQEVITIVFVFPRILLQCAMGSGFSWPSRSVCSLCLQSFFLFFCALRRLAPFLWTFIGLCHLSFCPCDL